MIASNDSFRQGSVKRFGALPGYVAQKAVDGFPIQGNVTVAGYIRHFLEYRFKRWAVENVLSHGEIVQLEASKSRLSRYFRHKNVGLEVFDEPDYAGLFLPPHLFSREEAIGAVQEILDDEKRVYPIQQKILCAR